MYEFRWNLWNTEHIAEHGVSPEEAEWVVEWARAPYPRRTGDRFLVRGPTEDGRYLQVVFVIDPPGVVYVIHARPLTARETHRYRRRS